MLGEYVEFGKRRPYVLFVLICIALFPPAVALLRKLPEFMGFMCFILIGGEWAGALRARLAALGLPHSRWIMVSYVTVVYIPLASFLPGLLWADSLRLRHSCF